MAVRIQFRRGTSTEWSSVNPVLADGELGFETDTKVIKFGDGVTPWNTLPVAAAGDITAVIAGSGLLGGATSGQATLSIDPSYVITADAINAAGDLIVGAGPDTYARLPIGPNGSVLVADSNQSVGVRWAAASSGSGAVVPTGTILPFAGTAPTGIELPGGFFLCDGQPISRSTYAALYGVITTTYGTGNGSSTFNVPDLRGKVPVGTKPGDSGTINFASLATTVGNKTFTLDSTKVPTHTHNLQFTAGGGNHDHLNITTQNESPVHSHTLSIGTTTGTHNHAVQTGASLTLAAGNGLFANSGNPPITAAGNITSSNSGGHGHTGSTSGGGHNHGFSITSSGDHSHAATISDTLSASVPINLVQESLVINFIIKT